MSNGNRNGSICQNNHRDFYYYNKQTTVLRAAGGCGFRRTELAEHGYRFCTESLEAKLQQHQDSPPDHQSGESDQPGSDQSGTGGI